MSLVVIIRGERQGVTVKRQSIFHVATAQSCGEFVAHLVDTCKRVSLESYFVLFFFDGVLEN